MIELLDKEAGETRKIAKTGHTETIEKIQEVLTIVEKEKVVLREERDALKTKANQHKVKLSSISKENQILHANYDQLLAELDIVTLKKTALEKEKDELVTKLEELKRKYETTHKNDALSADKRIKELQETLEKVSEENRVIQDRLSSMLSARSSSDDIQGLTQIQLAEMNSRNKQSLEENDKLRLRLETLFNEKSNISEILETRVDELEEAKRGFKYDLERLAIEHANKIRELTAELRKQKDKSELAMNNINDAMLTTVESQLSDFEFEDQDEPIYSLIISKPSVRDILQAGNIANYSELEDYGFMHSGRNIQPVYTEQLEQDIGYLEEIEEKDKEIAKLRQHITELKEKMSNEVVLDPRQEEDNKRLMLDLKHDRERFQMMEETMRKERSHAVSIIKDLEDLLVAYKIKYQQESERRDEEELNLMKKIKMLKFQVNLYEEQINLHNSGLHKK